MSYVGSGGYRLDLAVQRYLPILFLIWGTLNNVNNVKITLFYLEFLFWQNYIVLFS